MREDAISECEISNLRILAVFALCFVAVTSAVGDVSSPRLSALGDLPLSFEPTTGQVDRGVRFIAHVPGGTFRFTPSEIVCGEVRMKIIEADPAPKLTGVDLLPGKSNYFIGNDPAKWKTDVPQYARVRYAEVYPGVGLIFHGNQRQPEYDLVVATGADPGRIRLAFKGASRVLIDKDGGLVVRTKSGNKIHQHSPAIYQEADGQRHKIAGGYVITRPREVSFKVSPFDRNRSLVIAAVLSYSPFLGGSMPA